MSPELIKFLKENKDLINQNTKESWEEIYSKKLDYRIIGEFTQTILDAGINDPALILRHIPEDYLSHSSIQEYVIPNSVISIGDNAFNSCTNLTNIKISNNVTEIGNEAFSHCSSLTEIMIPDSVTSIGNWVFVDCKNLTIVKIGDSVTSIGYRAFRSCTSLTSITIPDSVTYIDDWVFDNCTNLKEIKFKGTRKEATALGIGNRSRKKWREGSSIQKIICSDGVIEF